MSQRLTYLVTVEVENTKGVAFNADQVASNIVGWNCSPECEGSCDFEVAIVSCSGAEVEWRRTGGKVQAP